MREKQTMNYEHSTKGIIDCFNALRRDVLIATPGPRAKRVVSFTTCSHWRMMTISSHKILSQTTATDNSAKLRQYQYQVT